MTDSGANIDIHPYDPGRPDGHNPTLHHPIAPDGHPEVGKRYDIPARQGRAVRLVAGQTLKLENPNGNQVCDFWAFNADDLLEFLSMEHLRTSLVRTIPRPGDILISNRRAPMLEFLEDTSPGIHDTIIAACDAPRYRQLGVKGYHDNCTDNLRMALIAIGLRVPEIPSPFNIWMNIPVSEDGAFQWRRPVSKPGDYVSFRAIRDSIAVMSACPQDITPVNGENAVLGPLAFTVLE